ncbi:Rid family hydrolase [Caulobacter soli]|uniref:Rid family hydrolase n=1 Tax=Caulobacter soli TaxID=2708539 RepID=UPI001FE5EE71|nr:Rid family hydrolase [Caulobacter soli]
MPHIVLSRAKRASLAYPPTFAELLSGIRSGDLLFVPGQVGGRGDGAPEPDFEAQVRLAFANIEATLKEAGGALSKLDGGRRDWAGRLRFRDQGHCRIPQ